MVEGVEDVLVRLASAAHPSRRSDRGSSHSARHHHPPRGLPERPRCGRTSGSRRSSGAGGDEQVVPADRGDSLGSSPAARGRRPTFAYTGEHRSTVVSSRTSSHGTGTRRRWATSRPPLAAHLSGRSTPCSTPTASRRASGSSSGGAAGVPGDQAVLRDEEAIPDGSVGAWRGRQQGSGRPAT